MPDNYSFSIVLEPQEGGGFTVLVPALPELRRKTGATPREQALRQTTAEAIRDGVSARSSMSLAIVSRVEARTAGAAGLSPCTRSRYRSSTIGRGLDD